MQFPFIKIPSKYSLHKSVKTASLCGFSVKSAESRACSVCAQKRVCVYRQVFKQILSKVKLLYFSSSAVKLKTLRWDHFIIQTTNLSTKKNKIS